MQSNLLSPNVAKPEVGSPAYHYEPRFAAAAGITVGSFCPEIGDWEGVNTWFKKNSMHSLASIPEYFQACKADWDMYSKMFHEQGCEPIPTARPWPHYPYSEKYMYRLLA